MVWLVWWMCAWMLEREAVVSFLPVKGETSMCSEIRVCKCTNISFTRELETNSKLLFLDILIDRSDDGFSQLLTNFDSFIPISFKRGLIYTLLDRYFKICLSYHLFHFEVLKLKTILLSNVFFIVCFVLPLGMLIPLRIMVFFSLLFNGSHALQNRAQTTKLYSSTSFFTLYFPVWTTVVKSRSLSFQGPNSHVTEISCQCCGALYFGQTFTYAYLRTHGCFAPLDG